MQAHLSETAFVDALEGGGSREDREHLGTCAQCGERLEAMSAMLASAASADVPDPSPFFWSSQRQRIREGLQAPRPSAWGWFLMPGLALAGITALGLVVWAPGPPTAGRAKTIPAWSAVPSGEETAMTALRGLAPAP